MKITILGHVIDLKGILDDILHILLVLAGALGINVQQYTSIFNQAVAQVQGDLALIHTAGWAAIAIALLRIIFTSNATPVISTTTVTTPVASVTK